MDEKKNEKRGGGSGCVRGLGCGDTLVLHGVLDEKLSRSSLASIKAEVKFDQYHALKHDGSLVKLPRKMGFQGTVVVDEGRQEGPATTVTPWYRCTMAQVPSNIAKMRYAPWTKTILTIKNAAEKASGESWNMCHIIHYRHGKDSMGFHSDTWLDLRPGSKIGVVSLGDTRTLELLEKRGNGRASVKLPHNSLFLLDEITNAKWTHGIRKLRGKRHVDERVAIVFRDTCTFISEAEGHVFGRSCVFDSLEAARKGSAEQKAAQTEQDARLVKMCQLKNVREWDFEGFNKFLNKQSQTNAAPGRGERRRRKARARALL
uniref:Fe2OG dioxygenase domain-containing protein n=1 Tax=Lotharella oceanica TaxID=641309 RepID=A0A7S2TV61_9EUKA